MKTLSLSKKKQSSGTIWKQKSEDTRSRRMTYHSGVSCFNLGDIDDAEMDSNRNSVPAEQHDLHQAHFSTNVDDLQILDSDPFTFKKNSLSRC